MYAVFLAFRHGLPVLPGAGTRRGRVHVGGCGQAARHPCVRPLLPRAAGAAVGAVRTGRARLGDRRAGGRWAGGGAVDSNDRPGIGLGHAAGPQRRGRGATASRLHGRVRVLWPPQLATGRAAPRSQRPHRGDRRGRARRADPSRGTALARHSDRSRGRSDRRRSDRVVGRHRRPAYHPSRCVERTTACRISSRP